MSTNTRAAVQHTNIAGRNAHIGAHSQLQIHGYLEAIDNLAPTDAINRY